MCLAIKSNGKPCRQTGKPKQTGGPLIAGFCEYHKSQRPADLLEQLEDNYKCVVIEEVVEEIEPIQEEVVEVVEIEPVKKIEDIQPPHKIDRVNTYKMVIKEISKKGYNPNKSQLEKLDYMAMDWSHRMEDGVPLELIPDEDGNITADCETKREGIGYEWWQFKLSFTSTRQLRVYVEYKRNREYIKVHKQCFDEDLPVIDNNIGNIIYGTGKKGYMAVPRGGIMIKPDKYVKPDKKEKSVKKKSSVDKKTKVGIGLGGVLGKTGAETYGRK